MSPLSRPRVARKHSHMQCNAVVYSQSWAGVEAAAASPETRAGNGGSQGQVVCPTPRRPSAAVKQEFLSPLTCHHCRQDSSSELKVDKLSRKMSASEAGKECSECSPCCYCGSPPRRVGNPVIHDVQFIKQAQVLPPTWIAFNFNLSDGFN